MSDDADSSRRKSPAGEACSDAELLRRYLDEASEHAFTELVRRHLDLVYSAAVRRTNGDAHQAADVAQLVFSGLARAATRLARRPALVGWLYVATRNAAVNVVRAEKRRRTHEQEAHLMQELTSGPVHDAAWQQVRPILDAAMDCLGERDREAVLLRYFEQRSFAEIGSVLNVSEDGARMRVERALDKLRGLLAQRGVTSTGAALATVLANQAVASAPAGLVSTVANGAVTGAAAAGSSAWAAGLGFMTGNKIIAVLGVAFVLAMTAAWQQAVRERQARAALVAATWEHAAREARLAELETRAATAEKRRADLERKRQQVQASTAAATVKLEADKTRAEQAAAEKKAELTAFGQAALPLLRNDPELKELRFRRHRANVWEDYAPLFREFGFTSAQIDKFAGLFATWADTKPERGEPWSIDQWPNQIIHSDAFVAKIRSEFGDPVAQRYCELFATRRQRAVVNQLESALYYLDEPFTPKQANQLGDFISRAVSLDKPNALEFKLHQIDWDEVVPKAEAVLSPRQMEGLRSFVAKARLEALVKSVAPKK